MTAGSKPVRLTRARLEAAVSELASIDDGLARITATHGSPPLWQRPAGFASLVKIILEQQVSQASAKAVWTKLDARMTACTPESFLTLSDEVLTDCGFSCQKMRYTRGAADAIVTGRLELAQLSRMDDAAALESLLSLKGVGPWTAQVYLLMSLGRPDIWPAGDLALQRAVQRLKGLDELPDDAQMNRLAESWRPWRAVAARILWHGYLADKRAA